MINGLSSPQPTPQRLERAPLPVDAKQIQEASGGVMTRDALLKTAEAKLENRNAFALLDAGDLHDLLGKGTLLPERARFTLDRPRFVENSIPLVVQLSEEGKHALLNADPAFAEALVGDGLNGIKPNTPFRLDTHVAEILLFAEDREALFTAYAEKAAKGEVPETIAGKPFKTYFEQHIKGTEDLMAEVELKNFRKLIPGFTGLPPSEQRVRAALGGKMADYLPSVLPGDVRRQMANSMIRHQTFDRATPGRGLEVAGEIKEFFHGTSSGKLIARTGFRMQPEMLFNKLPKRAQNVLEDKFRIRFRSAFGMGVYTGNATVASRYAAIKSQNATSPVHVVSGLVALGKTTVHDLAEDNLAHTRIVSGQDLEGKYFITREPKRFTVKGLTTLDPKQTDGWMRNFPQLLKAHSADPFEIGKLFDRLPQGAAQRALNETLKGRDPATVRSATLLLARRGDEKALASTMKLLEGVASPTEREVIQDTLMAALKSIGPGHADRTRPIGEAVLRLPPGNRFSPDSLAESLFDALGAEIRPMVERHGLKLPAAPAEGALARAWQTAAKGFRHLL